MHTLHVQAPTAAPGTRLEPGPWSGGFGSEAYGPPSGHEDRCTTAGGGRPREVLSCLWEPGRHDCQAEDNSRCPGPPLLTATLCCRAAAIPQSRHSDLLLGSRPPAQLLPLETWDIPRLTDCAFLLHLESLRVTKPGLWWKSGEDPQPSLGSWHLRGHYSQCVRSFVSTSLPVGVQYQTGTQLQIF